MNGLFYLAGGAGRTQMQERMVKSLQSSADRRAGRWPKRNSMTSAIPCTERLRKELPMNS